MFFKVLGVTARGKGISATCCRLAWRFMVLSNPTYNPTITLFGYLRGLYVGYSYTYKLGYKHREPPSRANGRRILRLKERTAVRTEVPRADVDTSTSRLDKPPKVYTFSSIAKYSIPKSVPKGSMYLYSIFLGPQATI